MAVSKQKKGEILEKLKNIVKDSATIVFLNFHTLPVKETSEIRKALRGKNVGYTVAKKSLTKKTLSEAGFSGSMPELPGELGIVYGADLLDAPREIAVFQKKFSDKLKIVGGVFDGKFIGQDEMMAVSQIPGLKTLQAQFVNLINSPIQGFVMALKGIADKKS